MLCYDMQNEVIEIRIDQFKRYYCQGLRSKAGDGRLTSPEFSEGGCHRLRLIPGLSSCGDVLVGPVTARVAEEWLKWLCGNDDDGTAGRGNRFSSSSSKEEDLRKAWKVLDTDADDLYASFGGGGGTHMLRSVAPNNSEVFAAEEG